ncbi:MAG: hypothetical protein S4CHLAM81_05490 [Chlamydiales bacterium]|nr:hypothetical protein [Chlamydiales bacterium]MCH9635334.1 hypothetical protein [Chlamydiales bacterium]
MSYVPLDIRANYEQRSDVWDSRAARFIGLGGAFALFCIVTTWFGWGRLHNHTAWVERSKSITVIPLAAAAVCLIAKRRFDQKVKGKEFWG